MRAIRQGVVVASVLLSAVLVTAGGWDPTAFSKEDTLEFLTVGPQEGEHWSRVWLVIVDNAVYIRLGSRAAERMTANKTAPLVQVRIAGQQFNRVEAKAAPQMKEAVARAMAEKYTSDFVVRYFDHPLTLKLTPLG